MFISLITTITPGPVRVSVQRSLPADWTATEPTGEGMMSSVFVSTRTDSLSGWWVERSS